MKRAVGDADRGFATAAINKLRKLHDLPPAHQAEKDDDDRAMCELDEPRTVCMRVTLNDDPYQHSGGECVKYTYFDL